MRNRSSRSFTVENKSGGRNQRTFIPHRATAQAAPRPAVSWPVLAEPQAPATEAHRILPNLIVPEPPEIEAKPAQVLDERSAKPRRGRPPKAKPAAADLARALTAEPAVKLAAAPPTPAMMTSETRPVRPLKSTSVLPLGERWKRRLGRWAR